MGIKYFTIEYDREVFYPGQMVTGRVRLSIDKPREMKAIELTLSGKAKCHWTKSESYRDTDGESKTRTVSCDGKETYFKTTLNLAGGGKKFELPIGDYVYPFSMSLPAPLPPSYSGTYGGITYRGKVKLDLPWARDKSEKKPFLVESPIDLNKMSELNQPYKNEKSKTFCCWCCASGPLTVTVYIPRTGFVRTEAIPMTIEVENASNVEVNSVKIELRQITNWKATNDSKEEKTKIKNLKLAGVGEGASQTWNEDLQLAPEKYPNSGNCGIIKIRYELEIELDAKGPHSDLEMKTPITIADIPLGGSLPDPSSMGVGFVPPQPEIPPPGFGYNANPAGFTATYPPNVPPGAQPNFGTPYPGGAPAPYPGGNVAPYPGGVGTPYPGAPGAPYPGPGNAAPYPGAPGAPNLEGSAAPYPGVTAAASYPGTTAPPYPGGAATPYSGTAGAAPYQPNSPQPYGAASYPSATSTPISNALYSQPAYAPQQTENQDVQTRMAADAPAETNPLLENK